MSASTLVTIVGGALLGAFIWSFLEYTLHRFAFHERVGKNYGSREHLRHHARREYSLRGSWLPWTGVFLVGLGLLTPIGWVLAGPSFGWSLGIGFVVGYFFYEWIHAASHLWAPRTAYGRWVRRHHFHHHFAEPMRNHGVTSPLWDHVFGTYTAAPTVTAPRRLAMRWLLDADGNVKAEHAAVYAVRGNRPMDPEAELVRAFANLAPET